MFLLTVLAMGCMLGLRFQFDGSAVKAEVVLLFFCREGGKPFQVLFPSSSLAGYNIFCGKAGS
jgi:hypothetical protein